MGLTNVPAILPAKKLAEITPPGLNKVFYSDCGATSVEIALKMAYQYWQQQGRDEYRLKKKFISLTESYHGTVEYFNLEGRVPVQMGTLRKALGSFACNIYFTNKKEG